MPSIMVVIPTYNERENLPLIVAELLKLPVDLRILVVDDGSPDGTGEIAEELAAQHNGRVLVMHRTQKEGLGPAYIAGFKHALSLDPDYIIQMDADFSHQPKYIQEMIARLEEGNDLVIASRFARGGGVDAKWGFYRKLLSWFANRVYVPLILNIPVTDATAGYRLWRRQTLIGLDLDRIRSNGYVFQVEMAYVTCRLGFRVAEIPIYFPDRTRGQSKMDFRITLEAALRVWQLLFRHRGLKPEMRRTEAYTV
ncbi:MAG TPA: polyprenol monophosphomannose synthase [Oceanobacillus sp.]|nr:polyprenol monophosphomannose synthase [Oceanobacillus sp.]